VLRLLRPIHGLTAAAERISSGRMEDLGHPLPLSGRGDELEKLTTAFNQMSARLKESFQQIHQFTLHASHELKTPLTVLRASLERELTAQHQTGALPDAPQTNETRLDEIFRMTKIVDGLSLLTRADAELVKIETTNVPLHELVRDLRDDLEALAEAKRITITLRQCDAINLLADRHRLRQLLLILADNAVKYNVLEGHITLDLKRRPTMAEFRIANSGPHISSESATHVFERFYRGDRSGGRTEEGCGLGLSIAQSLVELHHGTITFTSTPTANIITVQLPIPTPEMEDYAAADI
jgi:signal transduction histidine kinase